MRPKITAICCTYRRPALLEEALQSFLVQDYQGDKELIILNDEAEQELVFDHPQVKITNMSSRAPDLATKHNFAVSLATGEIIVPWDDDDLFLPHRLSTIAANAVGGLWYSDYLLTDQCDYGLVLARGKIHCNHAFSPRLFMRFGAYHQLPEMAFDFVMLNKVRAAARVKSDDAKPTYIYRKKTTDTTNYSGLYCPDLAEQSKRHAEANTEFAPGKIELSPHWSQNWPGLVDEALERCAAPVALHEIDKAYKPSLVGNGVENT